MAEQKSSEDWLPPGWTAEVRVRKTGKKDKCYTDPSNGLQFFSKPEVFRYLNNKETNHATSKGKRKGSHSRKLSAIDSPAVAEQQKVADSGRNGRRTRSHSSESIGVLKDDKTLVSATGSTVLLCPLWSEYEKLYKFVYQENDPGREGTSASASCFNLKEAADLEQREKSDPSTVELGLAPVVGTRSEKLPENRMENPGNKISQLRSREKNNRKKPDLPCRASKRLAGIEVGPIPELKTNNRARQASARRLDEAEVSKAESLGDSAAPEECAEKRDTEDNADDKKASEEGGSPLDFSLKDLWKDPCIEFAIKTLTDAIPIGDEHKAEEDPGSSLELPFGDSWGDPCIDFAVKTLTGAIPVVDDLGIPDYLQQQLSSLTETQQDKGLKFSNVGLYNSGDAGFHPHSEERSDELQGQKIRG